MTVQQQMTAASSFAELWKALLPEHEVPPAQQFLLWAGTYSDDLVSRGISRAAAKSCRMEETGTPMTTADAVRYAASVMKNELLGIRRHATKATVTGGAQR